MQTQTSYSFILELYHIVSVSCRIPCGAPGQVIERLVTAGNEYTCHEKLLAKAAAACCERPAKQRKTTRGRVEVSMLNF